MVGLRSSEVAVPEGVPDTELVEREVLEKEIGELSLMEAKKEWKQTYAEDALELTVRDAELELEESAEEELLPVEPVLALMSNCWD